MINAKLTIFVLVTLLGLCTCGVSRADPMGTAFTYQGQLKEAGQPADGPYDFEFALYDVAEDGAPLVPPIFVPGHELTNGLFTVKLDFGVDVFTGEARYLDVTVNGTTLSQRHELTPVPAALHAETAGTVLGSTTGSGTPNRIAKFTGTGTSIGDSVIRESGSKIGIGTTPLSLLHLYSGSSGTTPQSIARLVLEDNYHQAINFIGPYDSIQQVLFGDSDDNDVGYISYSHSGDSMLFGTYANARMSIDYEGNVGIETGDLDVETGDLDVAGDIHATGTIYGTATDADKVDGSHGCTQVIYTGYGETGDFQTSSIETLGGGFPKGCTIKLVAWQTSSGGSAAMDGMSFGFYNQNWYDIAGGWMVVGMTSDSSSVQTATGVNGNSTSTTILQAGPCTLKDDTASFTSPSTWVVTDDSSTYTCVVYVCD